MRAGRPASAAPRTATGIVSRPPLAPSLPPLCRLGKHADAIDDCNKSIGLDDTFGKAYIRRAQAGVALGTVEALETAVRDFHKAKELAGGAELDLDGQLRAAKAALAKARRKDYYKVRQRGARARARSVRKAGRGARRNPPRLLRPSPARQILDVPRDANEDDLRKAYRKQCLKYHPDKQASSIDDVQDTPETRGSPAPPLTPKPLPPFPPSPPRGAGGRGRRGKGAHGGHVQGRGRGVPDPQRPGQAAAVRPGRHLQRQRRRGHGGRARGARRPRRRRVWRLW